MKLKPKSTVKNPRALVYKRYTEIDLSITKDAVYKTSDNKYWVFDIDTETFIETQPNENYIDVLTYRNVAPKTVGTLLRYINNYFRYEFVQNDEYVWNKLTSTEMEQGLKIYKNAEVDFWDNLTGEFSFNFTGKLDINTLALSIIPFSSGLNTTIMLNGYIINSNKKYTFRKVLNYYGQALNNISLDVEYLEDVVNQENIIYFEYRQTYHKLNNSYVTISYNLLYDNLLSAKFPKVSRYQTNKYYYAGSFDYMIKGSIEGTTAQYIKGNIIPLTSLNIKYFDDIELKPDDLVVIDEHLYSVENPETVLKQQPKPFKIYFATLNNIL